MIMNRFEKAERLAEIERHFSAKANENLAAGIAIRKTAIALIDNFNYSEIRNVIDVMDEQAEAYAVKQEKYLKLADRALKLMLRIL